MTWVITFVASGVCMVALVVQRRLEIRAGRRFPLSSRLSRFDPTLLRVGYDVQAVTSIGIRGLRKAPYAVLHTLEHLVHDVLSWLQGRIRARAVRAEGDAASDYLNTLRKGLEEDGKER